MTGETRSPVIGPWPRPLYIGCVRCGDVAVVALDESALYVQCSACGKTCGLCWSCGRVLGMRFLEDALEWHHRRHHPDLLLTPKVRKELTSLSQADQMFRRPRERLEL